MNSEKTHLSLAVLSTYPPTECGIATYSKAIIRIAEQFFLRNKIKIIALDSKNYKYPKEVIIKIAKNDPTSYVQAAERINKSNIEIISLQHEYGMFGGKDGKYILHFLEHLKKPVVTTFHSVLTLHSKHRFELTKRIINKSQTLIVMTHTAKKILEDFFGAKSKKIYVIPHGGPNIRPESKELVKQQFGYKNKIVFSTFGLINPGKGIEYALHALKKIIVKHKNIIYLIIGATHPDIKKRDGEKYRHSLEVLVSKLKLHKYVKFINRYLDYPELIDYLKATDIYLAPQLDLYQAVSGTLAYAICCDNAVISTPTQYAKEILKDNRGIIVKNKNSGEIAKAVESLLGDEDKFEKIKFLAYQYGRNMIFPRVALEHLKVFEIEAQRKPEERFETLFTQFNFAPTLRYMEGMTAELGIVQHAKLDVPDLRFGYSIDDQARALIAIWKYCLLFDHVKNYKKLIAIYLDFIAKAQQKNKLFHNFMDQRGYFIDKEGSEDSFGRTLWALGYISGIAKVVPAISNKAKKIFYHHFSKTQKLNYIRAKAYSILGAYYMKEIDYIKKTADELVKLYRNTATKNWQWFENKLLYANAILPYALIYAYKITHDKKYLTIAENSFNFLDHICRIKNYPAPIGQAGWYYKGKARTYFDQQAIDVADMVLTSAELYDITREKKYLEIAKDWFMWFHGNNIHQIIMYDYATGGCYDGLTKIGVNLNEGAESVLVYLLAYLKLAKIIKKIKE